MLWISLDELVEDFRSRPLEGSYPFLWLDATVVKSREGGRVVNVAVVVAIGVHEEGHREILGLEVVTSEDGDLFPLSERQITPRHRS